MLKFVKAYYFLKKIPNNLWCGITVCNQQEANEKIPVLLQIPAAVRFLSIEPMLGPIDLGGFLWECFGDTACKSGVGGQTITHQPRRAISWVIVGGETGPGAREMRPELVRSIRDQCAAAKVPFFFKKWGSYKMDYVDKFERMLIGYDPTEKGGGNIFEGNVYQEYPHDCGVLHG